MVAKMATFIIFVLALTAVALACDDLSSCLFGGGYDFVDLTHQFDQDTVYWPSSKKFEFVKKEAEVRPDGSWYAANDFCAGEHGGTHLDAPYHFSSTGAMVGDITLDKLILQMYIVDVSSQVHDDPNFVLYKNHLNHMLNVFDTTRPALVLFKFGWAKFYSQPMKYMGLQINGTLNFPGISEEVAKFVTSYRNVVGVGLDTPSVDPGSSADFPAHKTLTAAGLYILENVKLDQELPDIKCTALVMPMKIRKGTGAPLRLAAICPKQPPQSFSARDLN